MKNEYMYRMVVKDEKLQRLAKEMHSAGINIEGLVDILTEKAAPDTKRASEFDELQDIATRLRVYAQELVK